MSHFYKLPTSKDERPELIKGVKTEAQARKHDDRPVASVTTKLGILANPFLSDWKLGNAIKIARQCSTLDVEQIKELLWGQREMPDGRMVSSSEFGTEGHAQIERALIAARDKRPYEIGHGWETYVSNVLTWLDVQGFFPIEMEFPVWCRTRKLVGTIDAIGGSKDDTLILWDYKFRDCKGKPGRAYPKDGQQLAIESAMLRDLWNLKHMPRAFSLIIDCETASVNAVEWKEERFDRALREAEAINACYNVLNMYE